MASKRSQCINYQSTDNDLVFMRHAQTLDNIGIINTNSPLSLEGIKQASQLVGEFDLVILSNLKRTQETLLHSNIVYSYITKTNLTNEIGYNEHPDQIQERLKQARAMITEFQKKYKKILVLSHGVFLQLLLELPSIPANCEYFTLIPI